MLEDALQHYQEGDYAAAETLYRKMLEDEPGNPEVLFMLALVRQQQNDLDEPVELIGRALEAQPQNATLHHALGAVQLRRGDLDRAERSFHEASGLDPNYAEAQNGIAFVEMARGRWAAAEHALRRALKSEADHGPTLVNMGIVLLEQGQSGDAVGYLRQALTVDPDNATAHAQLGRAFLADEQAGFAIQCFENALERRPGDPDLLELRARAQLESGQLDEAATSYREVLSTAGERFDTLVGLARAEARRRKYREAELLFLRALNLEPEDVGLRVELGRVLRDEERWDELAMRLGPVVDGQGEVPDEARRLLARARLELDHTDAALETLRPLLASGAPEDATRMLFARILVSTGEEDAAQRQLDRLLEADAPLAEAVLFAARKAMREGEHGLAIEGLRAVQGRHDVRGRERRAAARLLGDALHASGQYQQAWEQYASLGTGVPPILRAIHEKPPQLEADEPPESAMAREVAWSWPPQPPGDGRAEPILVFGWPGSGREHLLDALSADPKLCVVDDGERSQKARRDVIAHPRGAGPLGALTDAEVVLARRRYWKALRRANPEAGSRPTLDAVWLGAGALPTVYRLFPGARVVVVRRDPMDMALAWLQAGFEDLDTMAETYARELEWLERCSEGVPLSYIEFDYDTARERPGEALRELVSGLGLRWDEAVEAAFIRPAVDALAAEGAWENYRNWLPLPQAETSA